VLVFIGTQIADVGNRVSFGKVLQDVQNADLAAGIARK
jgi:hypothetical protein